MTTSPLSNELQELAAGYVLDDLETAEVAQVERLMGENPAFLEEIRQLQAVTGIMASSIPQMQPPKGLLDKIMATVAPPDPPTQVDPNQGLVNLGGWLNEIFESLWQPPEALNLAFSARRTAGLKEAAIQRGRVIELGTRPEAQGVVLLVGVTAQPEGQVRVSIQLHPRPEQRYLPANLQLSLRSESGEVLQSVEASQEDNYIQLPRFTVTSGFQFNLQINLDQFSFTERFVV
jgi:hypothetical protein